MNVVSYFKFLGHLIDSGGDTSPVLSSFQDSCPTDEHRGFGASEIVWFLEEVIIASRSQGDRIFGRKKFPMELCRKPKSDSPSMCVLVPDCLSECV